MLKFYVLSVLIFAILFGLEFFAIYRCTLKKAKRPSHIISAAVMAVLSCVGMLFLSEIISGIDWFLQLDGVKTIVSFIFGSVQAITMTGILLALLLLNLATLLAGLAIKSICNFILSRIRIPSGTYNPFAAIIRHFYETEEPHITRTKATVYRKWLLWAKHGVFALFALTNLALLTLVFFAPDLINQSSGNLLRIMILIFWVPTVSYLIINEFYYFLKGYDKYDEDYDYETEGISGTVVGDYSKLLRIYEETAGKANLIRTYSYNRTGALDMFNGGKATQAAKCDSEVQAVYEMIENKIKNTGVDICDEYANALVSMLNRDDVFVADTVIGEFSQYLFNYLNYQLCCNRKIIILCNSNIYSDKNRLALYMKMIRKSFRGINGYGDIWRIGTFESLRQNETIDILLSSYEEYIPEYTHRANSIFFDNVAVCVFLECLDLFGNDQFYSKAVFSHLEHLNPEIQYIFLSQSNSIMLKNAIDSMMNEHHPVAFYKNSNALKNLYVFIWKGESYFKPQIIFDNNAKYYYGTALPIGIIGAKYGVEKVNIIDCEETPYITYQHIMKDRAAEIEKAAERSIDFDNFFSYEYINYYLADDLVFLIVYDKYNNAAICKNIWGKIADHKIKILHIISEPYMLREFLTDNIDDVQIAEALVPCADKSFKRSEAESAIINMYEFGMKSSEIMRFCGANCSSTLTELLKEIFSFAFPNVPSSMFEKSFSIEQDICFLPDKDSYDSDRLIRFTNKALIKKLTSKDRYARISLGRPDEFKYLPIPVDDINNYCLEDQFISVDGESVLVSSVENGVIYGKLQSETNHYDYVSVCTFNHGDINVIDEDNSENSDYYVRYGTAEVTRVISDYYELVRGRNLTDDANSRKHNIDSAETIRDTIPNVQMLEITFNYSFSDNTNASVLFAELFNGVFRTLFPTLYKNIFACANTSVLALKDKKEEAESAEGDITEADSEISKPDALTLKKILEMIPCDISINSEKCKITVYEFSHMEIGLIRELKARMPEILLLLQRFIDWELVHSRNAETYLKYGFSEYPEIFPIDEIKSYLDNCLPHSISESSYNFNLSLAEWTHCDYCFKPILLSAHRLSDNRIMCNDCYLRRINARQEIEDLFSKAIRLLNRHYCIEIVRLTSDGHPAISVKFKSRYTINKKVSSGSPYSVVLGFFASDKRQLWVERGGPSPSTFAVLVHELTHAWQNDVFDMKLPKSLKKRNVHIEGISQPVDIEDIHLLEGQATYVEIEAMRLENQHAFADHLTAEILSRGDNDEYKIGYLYFLQLLKNSNTNNIFEFILREGNAQP